MKNCTADLLVIYGSLYRQFKGFNVNMINMEYGNIGKSIHIDEQMVAFEYFRLVKNKDINRLLDLFADDVIVYKSFSNIQVGLRGKSAIKPFLEIVLMANDGLQYEIEFEQKQQEQQQPRTDNMVIALVTFERGERVQARFEFKLAAAEMEENYDWHRLKKIQSLQIQFIY